MSSLTSDARVRFAAEALATLTQQVRSYCQSYPARLDGLRGEEWRRALQRFFENADTLILMLERMHGMARDIQNLQVLNFEQLEAELESARLRVSALRQVQAWAN